MLGIQNVGMSRRLGIQELRTACAERMWDNLDSSCITAGKEMEVAYGGYPVVE